MTSPLQFDRPAPPGDQFQAETHVGALLVIDVLEHVPPMQTRVSDKPQDSIRANVYVISPAGTVAEEYLNTLLWGRMLVSRLRQSVGRMVLGVLTGQPGVKRDGRNIPYDLDDPNDAMEAAAVRAMTQHRMRSAPPAQQEWGQQPATGQPGGWPQQGPPPGWGQQPQQGPPPGWGQQPVQQPQQPAAAGPWGSAPQQLDKSPWGQQPLPTPPAEERPPWEQQPAAPPWGGQQ